MNILEETFLIPVGSTLGFDVFNFSNNYTTVIRRDGRVLKNFENFYCRNVFEEEGKAILVGFRVDKYFFRSATMIVIDENAKKISEVVFKDTFSEFYWSDGIVVSGNFYRPDEDVMNGGLMFVDDMKFIKLPDMLIGEYELRDGVSLNNEYFFYGIDKDNYRGIVVKLAGEKSEFLDIEVNNDLWEFSGISSFNDKVVLSGNKWGMVGLNGFIMFLDSDSTFEMYDVPIKSFWFETMGLGVIDGKLFISVFDFDSNEGLLMYFDGNFEIVNELYNHQFVISRNKIFARKI
ncbi:MAG: hypothetical protein N2712_02245 [Brevinematales bacterium]|nr:hypothetical protein [Brevinematales bacterium]